MSLGINWETWRMVLFTGSPQSFKKRQSTFDSVAEAFHIKRAWEDVIRVKKIEMTVKVVVDCCESVVEELCGVVRSALKDVLEILTLCVYSLRTRTA